MVATLDLKCKLDLLTIKLKVRNSEYKPHRFPAVIMRIRDPKCTAMIYKCGKMTVVGAKNEIACKIAAKKFTRIISKLGFKVSFTDFRIRNMVATFACDFPIKIE